MQRDAVIDVLMSRRVLVAAVVTINVTAFFAAMAFDPSGLDRCEAVPTRAQVRAQLVAEGFGLGLSVVALALLVAGYLRDRRQSRSTFPRFAIAALIVCSIIGLVGLRWISGFGTGGGLPEC